MSDTYRDDDQTEDAEASRRDTAAHIAHLPTLEPDQREEYWLKHIYQGDHQPQLTLRAIVMGAFLGGVMALSNLYVGLRIGWAFGVAITACILSYSISKVLKVDLSLLENNCMQSTASSAGYSTGGTMVSGVCAYLMLTGHHMSPLVLTLWTLFLAALGVFIAIPMKRQMIDIEQLRFPSGIAAAETLRSLHAAGEEASAKARVLGGAGAFAAVWKFVQSGLGWIPEAYQPAMKFAGYPLWKWTVQLDFSWLLVAAGAIMGWRPAWSMLLGAFVNYLYLAPAMVAAGAIHAVELTNRDVWTGALWTGVITTQKLSYREIVGWSTWTGVSIMVTSSLLMFALQWRTILRAFGGILKIFGGGSGEGNKRLEAIEVPASWFFLGSLISGAGCVGVLIFAFQTRPHIAILAVLLSFVLCMVACRVTGETDTTPMGAMGKVAQLTFGVLAPSNMITNLMTASVTAGAASSSADLLTDLKSGYLLGANPRRQFIAQFLGIFTGTLVVVPAFYLLIPNAEAIGGTQFPAPAAMVWKKVAEVLSQGFWALHVTARWGLVIGGLIGLLLPLLEMAVPKSVKRFIPAATGLGLSFVIPFSNSLSIFIGAVVALIWTRVAKDHSEKFLVPLSSGLIAGESLMGIGVAVKEALTTEISAVKVGWNALKGLQPK